MPPKKKAPMVRGSSVEHFSMLKAITLADLITLLNSSFGTLSILSSIQHLQTGAPEWVHYSTICLCLALFFDIMDGKVARRFSTSYLGQDLDSLADIISFGVAPAILGFCMGLNTTLDVITLILFVNCGVLRLARFNATVHEMASPEGKVVYYEGTPIPSTVFITLLLSGLVYQGHQQALLDAVSTVFGARYHSFIGVYGISGVLQISKTIRIKKL